MNKIDSLFDQHVHSHWSVDSSTSIEEYIAAAKELGINTLVFTNHIDYDYRKLGDHWLVDFDSEKKELDMLSKKHPEMNFFQGVEIGYTKRRLEMMKQVVESHHFNVVNYSMHYFDDVDFYHVDVVKKIGLDKTMDIYFNGVIEMLDNFTDFDVLSHIDYGFKTIYLADSTRSISQYEGYLVKILSKLISLDKTLEINTKVQGFIDDENHLPYLLKLYKSLGGKYLTLSSDAHTADKYCFEFDKYKKIIKENGFDELAYFIDRKRYLMKI